MSQAFWAALVRGTLLSLATGVVAGGSDYLLAPSWQHALVVGGVATATAFIGRFGVEGAIDTVRQQPPAVLGAGAPPGGHA